jgi:flagellar biosynthesis/type III secretory pathway chaperone
MSTETRRTGGGAVQVSAAVSPAEASPARSVLVELADLLDAERAALISLDREAISEFATRKLELDQALTQAVQVQKLGAAEQTLLERVRQSALSNQLLLAHARSCVQGVLSLLTPANTPRYTAPGQPAAAHSAPEAPPIALNLRR